MITDWHSQSVHMADFF